MTQSNGKIKSGSIWSNQKNRAIQAYWTVRNSGLILIKSKGKQCDKKKTQKRDKNEAKTIWNACLLIMVLNSV